MKTKNKLSLKEVRNNFYGRQLKCDFIMSNGKKCKAIRKVNSPYCHHHTKDISPTPSNPIQSNIHNDDLSFEIVLLKKYLRTLIKQSPKEIDPKFLRLQLQLIEQIRKLVHSLSIIKSQSKVYITVTKIINSIVNKVVEVINKHSIDETLKEIISNELLELSRDRDENNDLNQLLKTINPKTRNGIRF